MNFASRRFATGFYERLLKEQDHFLKDVILWAQKFRELFQIYRISSKGVVR